MLPHEVSVRTEWDGGGGMTFQPVVRLLSLIVLLLLRLVEYSSGKEERSEVPPEDDV